MGHHEAEPTSLLQRHRLVTLAAAVAVPLLVCLIVGAVSTSAAHDAALILVAVVVAAAATGMRSVGLTAAVAGALAYDFFLTAPYLNLAIFGSDDLLTTALLLLVGIGTTELALWGRRQQGRASRQRGYLSGVMDTATALAEATVSEEVLRQVSDRLVQVLGVDAARYVERIPANGALLGSDGIVVQHGRRIDVGREGLPTDDLVVLPAGRSGSGFLITSSTSVRRLTGEQCRVAVTLAEQVGAALERDRSRPAEGAVPDYGAGRELPLP